MVSVYVMSFITLIALGVLAYAIYDTRRTNVDAADAAVT
jgi:heme/copper-type cytochrome/quinol oxidase subunit 2